MKKLLSLPPNLVECFHDITGHSREEWFCTHDPVGQKLGSGGGTAWLLQQAFLEGSKMSQNAEGSSFSDWLASEKRILLHAGGQSRRLPSYAPSGKILTPIPVFRWERGQRLSQDLLSLQIPLYEQMMAAAPDGLRTMVVSGDVYIRATEPLQPIPDVDVVCYGLWLNAETATHHGVFVMSRERPDELKCMLQKPSVQTLNELLRDHLYLTDIGVWMLSDRAVELLMKRASSAHEKLPSPVGEGLGERLSIQQYDLYSEFGCSLGTEPTLCDDELSQLKVAILPLPGGEFYHFGTSRELISSMLSIQNLVNDQREILHHARKPHPSIFQQNAEKSPSFTAENQNIWVENSCVSEGWTLTRNHVITGVPENRWQISLDDGQCVDIVPIGEKEWAVRPYHIDDSFSGDQQFEPLFPVVGNIDEMGIVLRWMLGEKDLDEGRKIFEKSRRLSAEDISTYANLRRLNVQRRENRMKNWPALAANYQHSVFYQIDLEDAAREFAEGGLPMPKPLPETEPLLIRMSDAMFRSGVQEFGRSGVQEFGSSEVREFRSSEVQEKSAFELLSDAITADAAREKQNPRLSVHADQIVWGRSPVRIDLAGGWTDTPPYCLMEGGSVINMAIELNGQQPLQTYVKPCREPRIILRSIDLGATEIVETYEQLADYNRVGSPFSIPKAALALAGFLPEFSAVEYTTLADRLKAFGAGIELTMLSAIPAGSGLGTSSILAGTVLGALSDFCGLSWDKNEIGRRTLILEQLLTTGGGWQDQFGGLLAGVKLLETERGFHQQPVVRWLPDGIFTHPDHRACHLLYYTGITRTAKQILAQIVRRMFLNQHDELAQLRLMKQHTMQMYEALQRENFEEMGRLVRKTWQQNQQLDSGTNPPEVARITALIDDLCLGYKLPGAGGGGYLYMVAKDPDAAARIRQKLLQNSPNHNARFVDMTLSHSGLQVSRS
ncbi:MAG: bifunctional fucokinase/L-fucose-1-P-guanylyltransferase [Prevotella sp.]|nr:bifunctional fucokinase/L-fucose-1-P-guanylyltransferase [Prevotella sp.]